jgi:hypothetical protein
MFERRFLSEENKHKRRISNQSNVKKSIGKLYNHNILRKIKIIATTTEGQKVI